MVAERSLLQVQPTGRNKLCHWKGRIIGIIDKTIADRTPCMFCTSYHLTSKLKKKTKKGVTNEFEYSRKTFNKQHRLPGLDRQTILVFQVIHLSSRSKSERR